MAANKTLFLFGVSLALRCGLGIAANDPLSLTVHVTGAKPGQGQVICALFSSATDYLKKPLGSQTQPVDDNGDASCHFSQLIAGTYAVSVIYDEDRNGKLNTGLLGIPTELVGMSNNAKGMFGPPSFEKSSFSLLHSQAIDILLGQAKE